MTSKLMNSLEEELNSKLGDLPFYTILQLISIGLFSTKSSARDALREGRLAFVRISPRRIVIPRVALLEYLRKNFQSEDANDHP